VICYFGNQFTVPSTRSIEMYGIWTEDYQALSPTLLDYGDEYRGHSF